MARSFFFVEHGLQFSLSYYINDPQNGQANIRSDVNLAVLQGLRSAGVKLPIPKQVLELTSEAGASVEALQSAVVTQPPTPREDP